MCGRYIYTQVTEHRQITLSTEIWGGLPCLGGSVAYPLQRYVEPVVKYYICVCFSAPLDLHPLPNMLLLLLRSAATAGAPGTSLLR